MMVPAHFDRVYDSAGHRHNSAKILVGILMTSDQFKTAPDVVRTGIVIGCERGILNRSIQLLRDKDRISSWIHTEFIQTYLLVRHLLCSNLMHINQSRHLEGVVMTQSIPWANLTSVPTYMLIPDLFKQKTDRIFMRKPIQIEHTFLPGYTCRNCGAAKVKEISKQTRSADESSNRYLECYACKRVVHAT